MPSGIVIDQEVGSNPRVITPIISGNVAVSGDMERNELIIMARQLSWEPLPVKLKITSQRILPNK
jgi:preprotein translocase subunit SecD